jgi:hypothetical protein
MSTPESLPETGPFLTMAVLCEKVLVEQGGAFSVIRVTDTLGQSASGPESPEQMPPFIAENLTMVIVLRAGQAKGRFGIKIRPEEPSGHQLPSVEESIQLTGGPWGASIIAPIVLPVAEEGVFWFDILLTGPSQPDKLLTRVPLEVIYSRSTSSPRIGAA